MKYENINDAKMRLLKQSPFIASFLFGLSMEIDNSENNPTASTDGKTIKFNEQFLATLNYPQLVTLIAHEVCHVAFAHHFRLRQKDARLWNVATDYAINLLLDAMGFENLDGWLLDYKYKGLSAEDIYKTLQDESKDEQEKKKEQSQSSGGSFSEPKNKDGNDYSNTELDEAKQEAKEKLQQSKNNLKRAMSAVEENDALDSEQKNEIMNTFGKGMSELISDIEFESSSRMDWREVLNRFLSSLASNDFSYMQPDQRFASSEFIIPSLYSNEIGDIFFALDVSGSCARDAKRLVTEAREVLLCMDEANTSTLKACYCSDRIHAIDTIESEDDIKLIYGGGTDFAPAVKAFSEDENSECLIYVTDGMCWSFGDDPQRPVLWVLTRRNDYFNPPFGEIVLMN